MNSSIQIEIEGLRKEAERLRSVIEELLKGKYPERGEQKTLRDEFACAALTGLLPENSYSPNYAYFAYQIADDMLEARKK